jgi:hypothetical protein
MASNIIDVIKDQLGDSFGEAAAGLTGLSTEQTRTTVGAAMPAVLAAILGSAATPTGSNALASALRTQDPTLLNNLSSILTGSNRQSLISSGINVLTSLLGESKLAGLVNALSSFGGMKQGGGRSLLGLLVPVVVGVLGQQQRAGNLNTDGLVRMLEGQRSNITSALPPSLATSLDSAGLLHGMSDTARTAAGTAAAAGRTATSGAATATDVARHAGSGNGNWAKYAVGLVVLALIGWGANDFVGKRQAEQAAQSASDTAFQVATTAGGMMVGEVDIGKEFTGIADGITQAMAEVKDAASAKAALPKLMDMTGKLDSLESLAAKLPDSAKPAFTDMVKQSIASLQTEIDRVSAIPDVSDTIKPTVDGLKAKLEALVA